MFPTTKTRLRTKIAKRTLTRSSRLMARSINFIRGSGSVAALYAIAATGGQRLAQIRPVESLRSIFLSLLLTAFISRATAAPAALPLNCGQCLVVTTESWNSTRGQLILYARAKGASWHPRGVLTPVRVGKMGLAWGRGIVENARFPGPRKVEGDNRAPAGIFRLASTFGYAVQKPATKMPYLALSENIVAVDDPRSASYNQLVDRSQMGKPDWRSAEKMILADDRYKWGVVVQHNVPPKPEAGSCIFLHVWKSPETATTGCTAMPEAALLDIIRWLDPARHPLLVQLPQPLYHQMRGPWGLP